MKKIILFVLLMFTVSIFAAVEKSGIQEFDSLVYSKGKTTVYFDASGKVMKTKTGAFYERKVFDTGETVKEGEFTGSKIYIVADYYISNKQPGFIFVTLEKYINDFEPEFMLDGFIAVYNEDGTLVKG